MSSTVLIVDDERNILLTLTQALKLEGYRTELAQSARVAFDVLGKTPVDVVLMDVKMPDLDGLTALAELKEKAPHLPVIMMSGHGTIETAVKATRLGARDFLEKPISRDRLLVALRNVLEHQRVVEALAALESDLGRFDMVGTGPAMMRTYGLIQRAAPSEGRVLITGENGSGKELIARALHRHSRRSAFPFVKLNCAAVPHELIESELFGHEKGAFTGALTARRGKFELAHQGTLFLDEVGDMPQAMQAKLLRVLQEGELERVGGTETLKVDVRVIAATNRDLEADIRSGRFREDLYFRLNVVQIHAPPLREHKEDLPALIATFLDEACRKNGRKPLTLSPQAVDRMARHDYPGNVRELKNLVERLAILAEGPVVSGEEADAFLPHRMPSPGGAPQSPGVTSGLVGAPPSHGGPPSAPVGAAATGGPLPAPGSAAATGGPPAWMSAAAPGGPSAWMGAAVPGGPSPAPGSAAAPGGLAPASGSASAPPEAGLTRPPVLPAPTPQLPGSAASPAPVSRFRPDRPFRELVEDAEREIILAALSHTRDNATEAARLLDLERGHFYKKLKALGLRRTGGETQLGEASAEVPDERSSTSSGENA